MKRIKNQSRLYFLGIFLFLCCNSYTEPSFNGEENSSDDTDKLVEFDQSTVSHEQLRQQLLVNSTSITERSLAKLQKLKPDHTLTQQSINTVGKAIRHKHRQIIQACTHQEEFESFRRAVDTPALQQFIHSLGNIDEKSVEMFIEQRTIARINQAMVQRQMALIETKLQEEGKKITDNERKHFASQLSDYFESFAQSYRPAMVQATIAHAVNQLQGYDKFITHVIQQQKANDIPATVSLENNASNQWFTIALLSLLGLLFGDVMWEKTKNKVTLASLFVKSKINKNWALKKK